MKERKHNTTPPADILEEIARAIEGPRGFPTDEPERIADLRAIRFNDILNHRERKTRMFAAETVRQLIVAKLVELKKSPEVHKPSHYDLVDLAIAIFKEP